ncbi:MAG: hypothetical protein V4533_16430 [Pseudomonadota bacterium]|jgi:hypothetical protein
MSSDRMMQAIGRMERALSQIERTVEQRADATSKFPPVNHAEATDALRSLDVLIAELKAASHG